MIWIEIRFEVRVTSFEKISPKPIAARIVCLESRWGRLSLAPRLSLEQKTS